MIGYKELNYFGAIPVIIETSKGLFEKLKT
jgi:hypothetical protein